MKNKVIEEALKWTGYLEKRSNSQLNNFTANAGSGNYTWFSKWYNEQGYGNYQAQPWCAMFVSFVFGVTVPNSEDVMPHFHYCPTSVNQFKKMGRWHTSSPQVGDVIFFSNAAGLAVHTGIVYNVDGTKVYTVEGNTSSASGVVDNGGAVAKKSYARNYNRILGYGRPRWEAVQVEQRYSYDDTVNNMILDEVTTPENMAYWERSLDGREMVDKNYVRTVLDRYHEKLKGAK